jgi:hypothetical protein
MKPHFNLVLALSLLLPVLQASPAWAQASPVVGAEPATSVLAIPSDLKRVCFTGPNTFESSPTCPVLLRNGYVYWAFSYIDNRVGMAVIAYDSNGKSIKRWDKSGARYLWQMTVNATNKTVSFNGQANETFTMTWDELYVPPPAQGQWELGTVTNNTDKHVMFSFHVPTFGSANSGALKAMTMAGILINDYGILSIDPRGNTSGCANPVWRAEIRFENQAWEFYYNTGTRLDINIDPDRHFTFTPGPGGQVVAAGQPAKCL